MNQYVTFQQSASLVHLDKLGLTQSSIYSAMYKTKIVFPQTTQRSKPRILRNNIRKRTFRQGEISFPMVSRPGPPIAAALCPYTRPKKSFYQVKIRFPHKRYSTARTHSRILLRAESRRRNSVLDGLLGRVTKFQKSFSHKDMVCRRSHDSPKAFDK